MDLSKLPLMPSAEVPAAVPAPVPEPHETTGRTASLAASYGCPCPSCEHLRMDLRGAVVVPPPNRTIGWSDIAQAESFGWYDASQAFATVTSTGRTSYRSPQAMGLPRSAPPVQESRRIRGRYDFSSAPSGGLHGTVRWREPGTLCVYDDPVRGDQQWTFDEELPDGSLISDYGRLWRPTEV